MGNQEVEHKAAEPKGYTLKLYQTLTLPAEYENLVLAPFLTTLRYGNDLFKLIDKASYFGHYREYIKHLLSRSTMHVRLAILDDGTVAGWCLFQDKTIHYIWVKKEGRRNGIAKDLIPKDFDTISHITNVGMNIWANKFPHVRLNPWA